MELFKAHSQWANRPADERFASLQALYDATRAYFKASAEVKDVRLDSLRVENVDGDVQLIGKGNRAAKLTHWAFGQLAARISAPASYLRTLPATLAAQNVNHGLAHRLSQAKDTVVNLLVHQNGSYVVRALTSDRYERIWNYEVAERLLNLEAQGWEPAKPDIRVIDNRLPLYASDHDMFVFLRHGSVGIAEPGNPSGLHRGVIVENSEVGASKLKLTNFLYREMCGNHIIWGAEQVVELGLRHVGNIRGKLHLWDTEIKRYLDSSAQADEAKILSAQRKQIAGTKDEVLDAVFGKRIPALSRKAIENGYDSVVDVQDGDPRSVWGLVQGLTRYSQTLPYADDRTAIDRAAGKLIDMF